MTPGVEAVAAVRDLLDSLHFSLSAQCIDGELKCMTGVLSTTDISHQVLCMVNKLSRLFSSVNAGSELGKERSQDTQRQQCTEQMDPAIVQVVASKSEVDARIAAFIARRRIQADESNIREFTDVSLEDSTAGMSCARARPACVQHVACSTHIKRVRLQPIATDVASQQGCSAPDQVATANSTRQNTPIPSDKNKPNLSEARHGVFSSRCSQLERHLSLPTGLAASDIHQRLKRVEERILELEARSPEYLSLVQADLKSTRPLESSAGPRRIDFSHGRRRAMLASHPYSQDRRSLLSSHSTPSWKRCGGPDKGAQGQKARDGLDMTALDVTA